MAILLSVVKSTEINNKHCYAVSMQGGGTCGSYEVGVVQGMFTEAQKLNISDQYRYDVVSGVSAGAIVSMMMSAYATGDEENMN